MDFFEVLKHPVILFQDDPKPPNDSRLGRTNPYIGSLETRI